MRASSPRKKLDSNAPAPLDSRIGEAIKVLTEDAKKGAFQFLRAAGKGPMVLKFCERFDEKSRIWNLREHSHPYLELIFFIEGRASVASSGNTLDVSLFDLVAYPPNVPHRETLDAASHQEIICLWLDLGGRAELPFSFKLTDNDGALGWLCQVIHANHLGKSRHYRELEDNLLKSLLLFMEQKLEAAGASGNPALDRSRTYIDEHYAEGFDVEALARVACVTPSYLSRLYRRHMGTTPMRYRNAVRIEKAKQLLLVKSASVEEIADVLGFDDTKYFSRLFKSLTALSPSDFRKKHRPA